MKVTRSTGSVRLRREKQKKRRNNMQTIKVMWDGINELDLMTLTEMGKDGYLFEIENGRIQNILMVAGILK